MLRVLHCVYDTWRTQAFSENLGFISRVVQSDCRENKNENESESVCHVQGPACHDWMCISATQSCWCGAFSIVDTYRLLND